MEVLSKNLSREQYIRMSVVCLDKKHAVSSTFLYLQSHAAPVAEHWTPQEPRWRTYALSKLYLMDWTRRWVYSERANSDYVLQLLGMKMDLGKGHYTFHMYSIQPPAEWVGRTNEQPGNVPDQSHVERCEHALEILEGSSLLSATLHNWTTLIAIKDSTHHESLSGSVPNNSRMQLFAWVAYMHTEEKSRGSNWADHAQLGIYLGFINSCMGFPYYISSASCIQNTGLWGSKIPNENFQFLECTWNKDCTKNNNLEG